MVIKETVLVQDLTRYGFKANNVYYNWSKQLDEKHKTPVVPGATFEMDIFVADSGKKYVNSVGKMFRRVEKTAPVLTPIVKEEVPAAKTVTVKHEFKPKKSDDAMTREDWDSKDRRISRQGCIQVAVQVKGSFDDAAALADQMLEYVNRK